MIFMKPEAILFIVGLLGLTFTFGFVLGVFVT